jgi:hypothetical protein
MRRLDFREASDLIKAVDHELEAVLRVVWDQAPRNRRYDLSFFLAKYPYKHFVFKNGRPLDPDGRALRADLLVANVLPVGLILDDLLEVVDEVIRHEEVIELPQSLLFKHQFVGHFELMDQYLNVEGRPAQSWTISSGSRSLKFLEFPTQRVQWDRLRAKYRHLSTYDKGRARKLREMELIEMIREVNERTKQWATSVLYFSSQWFSEIELQLADRERRVPAMELFSYFQRTGWSTLARVRYNDDQLTDALTEWGGDSDAARCKAAYLLLRYSLQILSRRRPCFGPTVDSLKLGPVDVIKDELLHVARLNRTILGPKYLQLGQTGFLSLSQLVPSAFRQNPEDSLEDIFKIISRARSAALKRDVVVPGLDDLPRLFSRLTFRVKSGRRRQKGLHGSVVTFKVNWLPPEAVSFQRVDVPFQEFYEPTFSDHDRPNSDSRFFRVAMRLDSTLDNEDSAKIFGA